MIATTSITYPIVETFHSVQGEGAWAGANAFFIRLGGCDVGCPWCDTKQSWPTDRHPRQSVTDLVALAIAAQPVMVVITGGEPTLHDLNPLTKAIHAAGLRVHLETAGSHPLTGEFDWITLSPKPFKPPLPAIYPQVQELKIIVQTSGDLDWAIAEGEKVAPHVRRYLQSEWQTPPSQQLIFDFVLHHPQWWISVQTHKFLGVR